MLDVNRVGFDGCNLAIFELNFDLEAAMSTGVIESKGNILEFFSLTIRAGDHQQVVNRSPDSERVFVANSNSVIIKLERSAPTPVLLGESIAQLVFLGRHQKTGPVQKSKAIVEMLRRDFQYLTK